MADHGSSSHLDLSYNNLSGKTPSSNQLFSCNLASCGSAYHRDMPGEDMPKSPPTYNDSQDNEENVDEFK